MNVLSLALCSHFACNNHLLLLFLICTLAWLSPCFPSLDGPGKPLACGMVSQEPILAWVSVCEPGKVLLCRNPTTRISEGLSEGCHSSSRPAHSSAPTFCQAAYFGDSWEKDICNQEHQKGGHVCSVHVCSAGSEYAEVNTELSDVMALLTSGKPLNKEMCHAQHRCTGQLLVCLLLSVHCVWSEHVVYMFCIQCHACSGTGTVC